MTRSAKQNKNPRKTDNRSAGTARSEKRPNSTTKLRIIGGHFRGRVIEYSGDPRTRPMKDNIREALFNLVGGWLPGKHVIDLFAGTGAIGLEALSRGANHVTLIERHFPTARIIRKNIETLEAGQSTTVITSDTFFWVRNFSKASNERPTEPWAVFCSPPYDLYVEQRQQMVELIEQLVSLAPEHSIFAVESDMRFDPSTLPSASNWRTRQYSPAQISVLRESSNQLFDEADD